LPCRTATVGTVETAAATDAMAESPATLRNDAGVPLTPVPYLLADSGSGRTESRSAA
jgi:hypothetical protein